MSRSQRDSSASREAECEKPCLVQGRVPPTIEIFKGRREVPLQTIPQGVAEINDHTSRFQREDRIRLIGVSKSTPQNAGLILLLHFMIFPFVIFFGFLKFADLVETVLVFWVPKRFQLF